MISQFGISSEVLGAEGMAGDCEELEPADYDMDPVDLFVDLGMLILESRQPHQSVKGRIESPHCPVASWKNYHVCQMDDPQCQEKEAVKTYIQFLCRNAIPMSIEVMLFPDCCYRNHKRVEIGAASEGAWQSDQAGGVVSDTNSHLLEQWIIQLLPKRFHDGHSEPHLLQQAVRSFLCFSQISSWLSSTKGRSPQAIVYRVCAPGEGFGANFEVEPEVHLFPVVNITKATSIKVSVAYPPREKCIPKIPCSTNHDMMGPFPTPEKGLLSRLEKRERDTMEMRYGGHHLRSVDSQSSSSDEGTLDERSGAKSKRNVKLKNPRTDPWREEPKHKNVSEDLALPKLDSVCASNVSVEVTSKQFFPFLDPPPLTSLEMGKCEASSFLPPSSESWEQSLADLEHKYSCLNLDEIPSTECSSCERDQFEFDQQKEIFELHEVNLSKEVNLDPSKEALEVSETTSNLEGTSETDQDDASDTGIVFTAECSSLNDSDSYELPRFEDFVFEGLDVAFNPAPPLDHRIRTVSDSVTCSPNVRLDPDQISPYYGHVQSSVFSEIMCNTATVSCEKDAFRRERCTTDKTEQLQKDTINPSVISHEIFENDLSVKEATVCRSNDPLSIRQSQTNSGIPSSKQGLLKNVLSKSAQGVPNKGREFSLPSAISTPKKQRKSIDYSGSYIFNPKTGLPINSSPALLRKAQTTTDCTSLLPSLRPMKSSPSCNNLEQPNTKLTQATRILSTSAPAATSCLLGNFEESVLNGRLEPLGTLEGFTAEVGASGSFCPKHVTFPVTVYFFSVADEDAPSSYYGHINMESLGKRGYRIPKMGTIQVILFNPNKTVVKMFVMRYDLSEMPPNCQTFARQRIFYMPSNADPDDESEKQLRYLLHLRFQSSRSGRIYLHTDIRMIFARHCPDLESSLGTYELRSFTEFPTDPRFSPKK